MATITATETHRRYHGLQDAYRQVTRVSEAGSPDAKIDAALDMLHARMIEISDAPVTNFADLAELVLICAMLEFRNEESFDLLIEKARTSLEAAEKGEA